MTRTARLGRCGVLVLTGFLGAWLGAATARAEDANKADLEALKKSLAKYEDYTAALRDLYLSTEGCVYYSGEKIPGTMDYPKGAMGVHFVNVPSIGKPLDPMKPNVLIYEPTKKGLKLVGVEWLVPLTPDVKEAPSLFGQKFMGPMEGHYPLIPKEFVHYDLHAWLFSDNPNGMFSPTNPKVKCNKAEFPMLEKPTKMMPGPM
ncbi:MULTISPECIES: hypothetical protein [unclassified Mesorhizobium]|uniref:hypothetical protein n=1 Tax=unclassified Mesorhizobium TaxID=325217 RepID=UPI000F763CEC|nr:MULTISPECIES: hypothetical protein [unclassified Mesorhizobium]AZO30268.1 hypothetical protein EJ071_24680 [Mesorhizobium sp. M1B.F.Ca.ET.045.04.1.1]RWD98386.1 MAG: hypothetical protein EOS40_24390 [Mesorhizobium sp.]TIT90051.1 MAG: hypothetical protein E5W55_23160 [Mesorhizobium sp.]